MKPRHKLAAAVVMTVSAVACAPRVHPNPPPPDITIPVPETPPLPDDPQPEVDPVVKVPTPDPVLADAPIGESVYHRDDGSCFYYESWSAPCPAGVRCNPPPPRETTVRCPAPPTPPG